MWFTIVILKEFLLLFNDKFHSIIVTLHLMRGLPSMHDHDTPQITNSFFYQK